MKEFIRNHIRNNSKKENIRDLIILIVLIVGFIAFVIGFCEYENNHRLYKNYLHQYESMVDIIVEQAQSINELQKTEEESEMTLYNEVNGYYKELTEKDSLTKDEKVFCGVFEQTFPSEEAVKKNKRQAYIKIYALLENYPEVKGHGKINETMKDIEMTTKDLSKAVKNYNFYVDKYNGVVEYINNTKWVDYHKNLKITENVFTKAVML